MSLKETLENYSKSNIYPFHMPGHKRMLEGCYSIDMTEVEGVDDLHDPTEVIAEEQTRLARLYGAKESKILVGGSTVGNLAAIYGCLDENDLILIQRNSHKSVYNGAIVRHLRVGYIYSKVDENGIYKAVTLEDIEKAVTINGLPRAIVITSPTYEGYLSDIDSIAEYCHKKDITLIVDCAHGAHLGPVKTADVTIMSLHKTLPALTQTAALHIQGERVDTQRIEAALDIFETSSPSYVLMNSISECLDYLEDKSYLFKEYVDNLKDFYRISGQLKHLEIIQDSPENKDIGKIVILTKKAGITGVELARRLREEYKIETELSSFSYVLAMTSIMDTKEGFKRLEEALTWIDKDLKDERLNLTLPDFSNCIKQMEPWQAKAKAGIKVEFEKSLGLICQDEICLYPPGAPVVVPGEIVNEQVLETTEKALAAGIHVTGIRNGLISVVN